MKTYYVLFVLFISSTSTLVVAQNVPPPIRWAHCYGGSGDDIANAIRQTRDGGYIVAGTSNSTNGDVTGNHPDSSGNPTNDFWIVKLGASGGIQWQRSLGGSGDDEATDIIQTSDGGYVVAGGSNSRDGDVSDNHGGFDYWIVKLDSNGRIQWQQSFGTPADDYANSIIQTFDGGYIVAGVSKGSCGIFKLDGSGDLQWQKWYGGSGYSVANSIRQTLDTGYIIAGRSDAPNPHGHCYNEWVVKIDSIGTEQWAKLYGGSIGEDATSILQAIDSSYIIAGSSISDNGDVTGNHGAFDYWIVKIDTGGVLKWEKSYGGSEDDQAFSISKTYDSCYLVAGSSSSADGNVKIHYASTTIPDYWILKIALNGTLLWQRTLGGTDSDVAYSAIQTTDSGFIIAGASKSNNYDVVGNHGGNDFWIVNLDVHPDTAALASTTIRFDTISVGSCEIDTVTITNSGFVQDTIFSISISGIDSDEFSIIGYTDRILLPGESEKVPIRFCPVNADTANDDVKISYGNNDTLKLPVQGIGISKTNVSEFDVGTRVPSILNVFPNPSSIATTIEYDLQHPSFVTLILKNIIDESIKVISENFQFSGKHFVRFDGDGIPSGVYLVQLKSSDGIFSKVFAHFR